MCRVQLRENLDLLLYIFNFIFCTLQVDDLNGYRLLCPLVVAKERKPCLVIGAPVSMGS